MIPNTDRIGTLATLAKAAGADYRPVARVADELKKQSYRADVAAQRAREEWHATLQALDAALRRVVEADPSAGSALALPITEDDLPYGLALPYLREWLRQAAAAERAA